MCRRFAVARAWPCPAFRSATPPQRPCWGLAGPRRMRLRFALGQLKLSLQQLLIPPPFARLKTSHEIPSLTGTPEESPLPSLIPPPPFLNLGCGGWGFLRRPVPRRPYPELWASSPFLFPSLFYLMPTARGHYIICMPVRPRMPHIMPRPL